MTDEALILTRAEGSLRRITLNRPHAINALNAEMFALLSWAFDEANADPGATAIVIDGAGDRGFCGGGDIKQISREGARPIIDAEYRLDYQIAVSRLPVISFMDGIAMGGGIGLGGHAPFRVVTERSRLAMPEVRLGIAPDVGGHLLLARAPGRLGELLAMTAGDMIAGDAIALGFADHYVESSKLAGLREALAAGAEPESAIAQFASPAPGSRLVDEYGWWSELAEKALGGGAWDAAWAIDAVRRLLAALETEAVSNAAALETLETIRAMAPTAVAATVAQIAKTRELDLDLAAVLEDDALVLSRLAARPDFPEGVRAQVIDKDRNPAWRPSRAEDVSVDELAAVLSARRADEDALGLR